MNYLVHGIAPYPEPPRVVSLKRSGGSPRNREQAGHRSQSRLDVAHCPESWRPCRSVAVGCRPPGPGSRASTGSGVSPMASGATRGVAFLVDR